MKSISVIHMRIFLLSLALIYFQCDEKADEDNWPNDPVVTLSAEKIHGHAQYRKQIEFSANVQNVEVDVSIHSPAGIKEFYITKKINLEADPTFGENGVLHANAVETGSGFEYSFSYPPSLADVDQLVGFTFTATNNKGVTQESDLILAVNLTPRENLPLRKWQLKSTIFVNGDPPNQETIQDCRKDDYMLLNSDGTWSMEYNTICWVESLEVWKTWSLSEDNKVFTRVRADVFNPDATKTDIFEVKELTLTTFHIQQTVDMTALGGGPEDTFLYKYVAVPR